MYKRQEKHGVEIENYRETEYACIVGNGVERNSDDDGNITEDVYETYSEYDCISATNYEKLTKIKLDIPQGKYYLIQEMCIRDRYKKASASPVGTEDTR